MATIAVVLLHIAANGFVPYDDQHAARWVYYDAVDSIGRVAVPLFLMISGATLLTTAKTVPLANFLRRRASKIVAAFLAWSIFYLFYKAGWHRSGVHFSELYTGPVFYHLPFVYQLMGLYLAAPLLAPFADSATPIQQRYVFMLWFGFSLAGIAARFLHLVPAVPNFTFQAYVGYFLMGRFMARAEITRRQGWLGFAAYWAGLAAITILVWRMAAANHGALDETFYEYGNPFIILMTLGIFAFFRSPVLAGLYERRSFPMRWLERFSLLSFGIYLLHPVIVAWLAALPAPWTITCATFNPVAGVALTLIATLASAGAIISVIRATRLTRWLAP